jgi:hypothetical protein
MSQGLKIKNVRSEIQIQELYQNYSYVQKGNGITGSGSPNVKSVSFTENTKYPPLILLRPNSGGVALFQYVYTAPNYTGFTVKGTLGMNFDYRVYFALDRGQKSDMHYGMRIKNNRGDFVFDSGCSPFTIYDVISATIGNYGSPQTYSHPGINNPFYIITPWLSAITCSGQYPVPVRPVYRLMTGISRVSATSFSMGWVLGDIVGQAQESFFQRQGVAATVIICDVGPTLSK